VIAGKDPLVGQALELLVPELDFDPAALLPAAHARAAALRAAHRRRRTVAAIALAVLLLFAGGAVAAQQFDLFSFLDTNDRNSARFSVSRSRTYHGAAGAALTCPGAGKRAFTCHVSGVLAPGTRQYKLGMRTDRVPLLTRQSMLAELDHAQANGADPAQVAHARDDLSRVGDDFIRALAILTRIETVGGVGESQGPNGTERVPPRGVPAWTACRELTLTTFRCRPLAALVGVAGGTPLYFLQPTRDWRRVRTPPQEPSDFSRLLERLLGRKVTADEERFFIDLATVAVRTGGSSGAKKYRGTPIGNSGARSTAVLAPQSLGVRTRVVSAAARPLPHGRLPGGLSHTAGTRLYRVRFDLLRSDGIDRAGRHTIDVYVTRYGKLGVWRVVWVAAKP
jgi:hypothetical protein